jgi:ABC-2 type transport system permease protein
MDHQPERRPVTTPDINTAAPPSTVAPAGRYGEVFDRGYKHYDGPRLGRSHAFSALIRYSIKRALGIKKSWTAKVIPIILYVAVALPVVISLGIRAFLPSAQVLDYPDFFTFIFIIEGIFVAMTAPEMLCGDRRENVLPLYFSRAITRLDYLLAKLIATAVLTLTMSLVPAVVLWIGRQLLDTSPLSAMSDHLGDLGRIFIAGGMIALYLGAIGLLVSSFTGRKSIAVAIIILGFLLSTSLSFALAAAFRNMDIKRFLVFLSPVDTISAFVNQLFAAQVTGPTEFGQYFSFWAYLIGMGVVIFISCAVMVWRYVPND